ncbi:MAG: hypothetical protein AB7U30_01490 [Sulfuricellaceae bacterium]|jgi:hypothetical protein
MKKELPLLLALGVASPLAAAIDLPISIQIGAPQSGRPVFSDRDRQLIGDYYAGRQSDLPPGLAKKKHLPPGLEKRSLPSDLDRRLSRLPGGYGRVIVGRDVLIINTSTDEILDILRDIVN